MKRYTIKRTESFDKAFSKLSKTQQAKIEDVFEQLQENPFVGKPLGYAFFREKKLEHQRIYYLIYQEQVVAFVIAISGKKDQQDTIDMIKKLIPHYKKIIENEFTS